MRGIASFRAVIDLWPTRLELAKRLGFGPHGRPITSAHVRVWYQRNRLHPRHFDQIVQAAIRCGFTQVTYARLSLMQQGLGPNGQPLPPKSAG